MEVHEALEVHEANFGTVRAVNSNERGKNETDCQKWSNERGAKKWSTEAKNMDDDE